MTNNKNVRDCTHIHIATQTKYLVYIRTKKLYDSDVSRFVHGGLHTGRLSVLTYRHLLVCQRVPVNGGEVRVFSRLVYPTG